MITCLLGRTKGSEPPPGAHTPASPAPAPTTPTPPSPTPRNSPRRPEMPNTEGGQTPTPLSSPPGNCLHPWDKDHCQTDTTCLDTPLGERPPWRDRTQVTTHPIQGCPEPAHQCYPADLKPNHPAPNGKDRTQGILLHHQQSGLPPLRCLRPPDAARPTAHTACVSPAPRPEGGDVAKHRQEGN